MIDIEAIERKKTFFRRLKFIVVIVIFSLAFLTEIAVSIGGLAALVRWAPRERGNNNGYKNSEVYRITTRTNCTVVLPTTNCYQGICNAVVKYKIASGEEIQSYTKAFKIETTYAEYTAGSSVFCYYDNAQDTIVSYFKQVRYGSRAGAVLLTLGLISIVLTIPLLIVTIILLKLKGGVIQTNVDKREALVAN